MYNAYSSAQGTRNNLVTADEAQRVTRRNSKGAGLLGVEMCLRCSGETVAEDGD